MKNEKLQRILRFTQWIAITFILVLGVLMAHDAMYREDILTASQERLDTLKSGSLDDPAIAKTVRDLDYLYRATYFQTQDRQAYGFLLLGIAFLILCLLIVLDRYRFATELKVPDTSEPLAESQRKELLIYSMVGIGLLAITVVTMRVTVFPSRSSATQETVLSEKTASVEANVEETVTEKIILSEALEEATYQWPQFRGSLLPNRNPLPMTWNFKIKWQSKIPLSGFNSPVVWADRIFVAGGDKTERAVFCFDAIDGKQCWKATCTTAPVYPDLTEDTGVSAPTLCVDKARVYAIFATGEMICCDHHGKTIWRRQLPTPDIMYGYASSPLLLGDRLVIQYDLDSTQTIYAVDVLTGKDIWKTQRQTSASWSSPVAQVQDGKIILFAAGNLAAEGIDANTGNVLWTQKKLGGEVATSAVVHNNAFYFANSGAITAAFKSGTGDILIRNDNTPAPDVASPVLVNDTFLLFSSGGSVIGISADKGEELFENNFDNGFYASPVVINGKVVAVNLDGDLYLLNLSSKAITVAGKFSIGKKIVTIPAFHRGNIIIRTADNTLLYLESVP
jgi:outer membrane protein assembly factor BamB